MIILDKKASFRYILDNLRSLSFYKKYHRKSKTQAKCLHCGKTIFVGYSDFRIESIFCPECYEKYKYKRTIVQYYYMKWIKDNQIHNLQTSLNEDNPLHAESLNKIPDKYKKTMYIDSTPFLQAKDIMLKTRKKEIMSEYDINKEIMRKTLAKFDQKELDKLLKDF